jgi:hypothetical protein
MAEIETTWTSAKRKTSGSEFMLKLVPLEFSTDQCLYRNPLLGLEVGFEARWIYDTIPISKGDDIIHYTGLLGVILIDGQLQARIEQAVAQRELKGETDEAASDCYELIVEFIHGMDERQDRIGVQPHLYVAPSSQFSSLAWSVQVRLDAVTASGAVQIR